MGLIKLPEESINYFKSNLDEIFISGNLAEGPWSEQLSDKVKLITNVQYAIPTASNGSGIVALLQIYKQYYDRNKVMIQSNTMYGVKTMVASGGYELVAYIDCCLESLMPSIKDVENTINSYNGNLNELIILLSDIGGGVNPDAEKIGAFCKHNDIVFIEDCAHSFGATLNGKCAGTFGDAGVYSFYATKAIFAGEGGVVVTDNEEIGNYIKGFTIYDRFDQKMPIGFNIRPSEIQALLIYSVVKEYEEIIDNKTKIAEKYIEVCKTINIQFIDQSQDNLKGNYYKFIIISPDKPIRELFPNIRTTTSPVYDYSIGVNNPLADHHLCLPIWYGQDIELTLKVCEEINRE
jgi:dTDP-4-amino-4,6-dideoxygalactose transaminase